MLPQWIGELSGEMRRYQIKSKQLAQAAGWNPKYLSAVLNGHRAPKKAEQKLWAALNELIHEKQN